MDPFYTFTSFNILEHLLGISLTLSLKGICPKNITEKKVSLFLSLQKCKVIIQNKKKIFLKFLSKFAKQQK